MAEKKYKLIGVGSPIVDSLAQVDEAFVQSIEGAKGGMELVNGEQLAAMMARLDNMAEAPGGSAGNTAVAVARLGLPTTFLGKIGNDVGGEFYRDRFVALGGDGSRFKIGTVENGRCLSLITPDSERTMRTNLGAAMTLAPDEVSAADFAECKHAHIEGYILFNRDLMYKVLDSAKEAGCTISLDLASFEVVGATKDILEGLLKKYVDIVFANEEEGNAFTGLGEDYEAMALKLGELCSIAVVKIGAKGSLIAENGTIHKVEPIVIEQAVDTTGAGDLWAGGFLYGWLSGNSLAECGEFGSKLGAEVVQVIGAALSDDRWKTLSNEMGSEAHV
ncbi:adenosine kinase [Rubellicoccus peritrichatus]|uniref:Adenosine kinase n=1 Tax=Rubellicoccus peritrichatus TaxID=3080537 RepID=A0AAQ3L5Q5_9BACT|nr:adenosine kinase [Puniceicoccus sp. CR14]WOO39521.1 adenosine kinase [Puniceicoccus sp. CR14]